MTASALMSEEIAAYVAAVRAELADLPPAERDDLIAEVEASLAEAEAEGDSARDRLGPPEHFAAELRAAAGLQVQPAPAPDRASKLTALRATVEGLLANPRVAKARGVALELAPVWWVLRGYGGAIAVAHLLGHSWSVSVPVVPSPGGAWVLAIGAAMVASVWLGLRSRHPSRRGARRLLALNVVLVIATLIAAQHAVDVARGYYYVLDPWAEGYPVPEAAVTGAFPDHQLNNIYPYDRQGRLLHDVLLYDSLGRPLDIEAGDPNRRLLFDRAGQPVLNAFPIRYFEPGSRRVADPDAGPDVKPPKIVTPPVER